MIEPEIVTQLIGTISDIALVMSQDCTVLGVMVNPDFRTDADLKSWESQSLKNVLTIESVPKLEQRVAAFLENDGIVLPVELNHTRPDGSMGFPVRYSFHRLGTDGTFLMLGSDLRPIWEIQQQLVAAQIALEKDYETQRENDSLFRALMASSEDAVLFVSAASGRVTDCNPQAASLIGRARRDIVGASFVAELGLTDGADLLNRLAAAASDQAISPVSVTAPKLKQDLQINPTIFRVSGEQMLLCRVRVADIAPSADGLTGSLNRLFEDGMDAIAFAARDGRILSVNDAFLQLADVTNPQSIKGRTIADFLTRGSVDQNVILENASRSGGMRMYATRLMSDNGAERQVEIATSLLKAGADAAFALVIRDVSRASATRAQTQDAGDVDMSSVVELIGSQSLKDIVAKTTDVVEKMCIETAVEMTSNNRVAAAEMLGLSRQSLYVKLRKYGLVKKDG